MTFTKDNIVFEPISIHCNFKDLTNKQFGRLTVLGYAGKYRKSRSSAWWCECECGTIAKIWSGSLQSQKAQSCGCLQRERTSIANRKHGEAHLAHKTVEYTAYVNAKERCTNPNDNRFRSYGERGIRFLFTSYEEFLQDVGRKPTPKHSLNRIDNDGHYEVGNVEWALPKPQARNTRSNHIITIQNTSHCVAEWAELINKHPDFIHTRLSRKWCDNCAIMNPVGQACTHR